MRKQAWDSEYCAAYTAGRDCTAELRCRMRADGVRRGHLDLNLAAATSHGLRPYARHSELRDASHIASIEPLLIVHERNGLAIATTCQRRAKTDPPVLIEN